MRVLPSRQRPGPSRKRIARGLPAAYIVQQMADFKNGDRKSAEPRMGLPNAIIQDAKAATRRDKAAAAYLSSFPFKMESRRRSEGGAPDTIAGSMHVPTNDGTEPLGQRIIEVPEDLAAPNCGMPPRDSSPKSRLAASQGVRRW